MIPEIWPLDLKTLFVGSVVTRISDTLGFYHLHPRDRFWELLELGAITPKRVLTKPESKALADGHRDGSLSDPIRQIFIEKKTSQLLKLGIGITDLNRRMVAEDEKDKSGRPTSDDLHEFVDKVEKSPPRLLGFVIHPDLFVGVFKARYPSVTSTLGPQPFTIGQSEVWLLGSTTAALRGEALTQQEDAFVALGERMESFSTGAPP
ncbi:MAG: hypothetical protein AB1428_09640 [Bacteroidota bacterium]